MKETLQTMLDTMVEANGVGLAAPQIGISKRLVVIDVGEGPRFLINPEITSYSTETESQWEGCLSWPGYIGEVERPAGVTVKALDEAGREIWIEGEGLLARCLQHEIDHLDGILFVDRATTISEVPPEPEEEPSEKVVTTKVQERTSRREAEPRRRRKAVRRKIPADTGPGSRGIRSPRCSWAARSLRCRLWKPWSKPA